MNQLPYLPKIRFPAWGIPFVLSLILLTGCSTATEDATISPDQAHTSVAQTVTAAILQTMAASPTKTQTPTLASTATESSTVTSEQSQFDSSESTGDTPAPTAMPTAQSVNCDSAMFISDVTIPDGTDLEPGNDFTKTWRLKNNGSCTWDSAYSLVYSSGDLLKASSPTYLNLDSVLPGESTDISVDMIAPESIGNYIGYWRMQNASGIGFGDTVYVQIDVLENLVTYTPTATIEVTKTPTPTDILLPTSTIFPTETPISIDTPVPSNTPLPTGTSIPLDTPTP